MNLPNKLTCFRMVLVPIIVCIYLFPFGGDLVILNQTLPVYQFIVVILFAIASLTDMLDGKIARKNNLITTFGKFMDPIADKLLVNSLIILLACSGRFSVLVALVMIARDLVVDAIRLLASQNQVVLAASQLGKLKTVTQMIGIILVLINNIPFHLMGIPMDQIMIWIATAISFISGVDYFMKNKEFIMESM